MNAPRKAVCLLSAGLDSSVALALAREQGVHLDVALTVDYGQRAAAREIERAAELAAFLAVKRGHLVLSMPFFPADGGALLDRSRPLPRFGPEELDAPEKSERSASQVWVPNRNGVLLETAAMVAEQAGCDGVVVGFNREEAATFPDNSHAYLDAINAALHFSTRHQVKVWSPTIDLDKAEILREAVRLSIPLDRMWPCYEGGESWCRTCESCARFLRAARRAHVDL